MLSSSAVYFYSYLVSSALNILALFVFGFWLANAFYGFLVSLNLILTTLGQGLILVFFLRKRTSKAQHTKAAFSNNSETSFTAQSTAHPPIAAGLNKLLEDYPQYAFVGNIADAWIADLKTPLPIFSFSPKTLLILLLAVGIPGIILLGTAATLHAFHLLNSSLIRMSPKTRALHKKLVRGLALQVFTPIFSMAVPGVIAVFTVITDSFPQQWFINASTLLLSLHGGFGSLSIILFTESYRQHTRNCLKIVARFKSSTIVHTIPSIIINQPTR
ncbi:unnamed protein product, partial [Mesorhabditis belari]|uniref:Uncharacterized protein n=1 Tax=Mesorhabditis belari TaxID=2138241 RepID=A0AAF3EVM0_9BILA